MISIQPLAPERLIRRCDAEQFQYRLQDQEIEISYRRFYPQEEGKLVDVFQNSNIGLLVFGTTESHLGSFSIQGLLELLDVPVLVIR